jgi:hypothetical protein
MVFDVAPIVTMSPFGDETIVPAGTCTDMFAVMVRLAPAASVVGAALALLSVLPEEVVPALPPQALNTTDRPSTKTPRDIFCIFILPFQIVAGRRGAALATVEP